MKTTMLLTKKSKSFYFYLQLMKSKSKSKPITVGELKEMRELSKLSTFQFGVWKKVQKWYEEHEVADDEPEPVSSNPTVGELKKINNPSCIPWHIFNVWLKIKNEQSWFDFLGHIQSSDEHNNDIDIDDWKPKEE